MTIATFYEAATGFVFGAKPKRINDSMKEQERERDPAQTNSLQQQATTTYYITTIVVIVLYY